MWEILKQLFSPSQYIPHGHCYLWQSQLVWLHIVSDLLIAIAYFSIPATLVYFIHKRKDVPFLRVFGLFGAFIVLCGTGHLLEIWTLWYPAYWLTGIEKVMTALVSCYTALEMVTLLPQFLALQTPERVAAITEELETRINEATEGLRQRTTESVKANAALETEIQERIVAGTALRANQDFLKRVLNSVTDPIFVKDPHHRWTMVNDSFCQMVGVSREELLGRTDYDFFTKAEADVFWEYDNQVFTTGNEYENEEALTDASGKLRVVSTKKIVFTDASGSQCLVGIIRDITKRKQVEAARQQIAERERAISNIIQQMRQTLHLETIFSATTQELRHFLSCDRVVIYRFNPDWSGEFVSESVVLGWISLLQTQTETNKSAMSEETVDEADCVVKTLVCVDNPVQDTDTYLQETQGGVYSQGTTYISVPDIYKAGFQSCYLERLERIQAKAYITVPIFRGKKLWGLLAAYQNSAPRLWEEAEIKMMVQIGTQLGVAVQQAELLARTQRQAEELQQAKETADAANRAKSEFLANMSHELRTPLNAILGFTQVMQRDSSLSTEQQQYLNIVGCSGEHLLGLINDVLEMAKIEAGRATLHENSFNFHHLLDGLKELLQMGATSKGLQLNFEYSDTVPQYIKTDANKLRQVLINLLSNAIKFTQIGSVTLRVSKQLTTDNEQLTIRFEVEDTGQGIAPSELNDLFEPFTQTETGLKHSEGSGLGLPISQQFVQLMGGEIAVSSMPSQGSKFAFDIQVSQVEAIPAETAQPICRKVIGLAPNQPVYRILVAEDKLTNRLLLVKILSSFGFEVQEAENGQEAVDMWESWEPHLIWMDMRMPVMNGYEATKHIKASLKGQATVIIALTASAFDEQRQAILLAGCDDFMHKPFREENLLKKINQHLGVQYIYEEKDEVRSKKGEQQNFTSYILNPSSLNVMSAMWVKQLHHAAAQGSDLLLQQLIEQIPEENRPLTAALTNLVENFRFDSVMELAQLIES